MPSGTDEPSKRADERGHERGQTVVSSKSDAKALGSDSVELRLTGAAELGNLLENGGDGKWAMRSKEALTSIPEPTKLGRPVASGPRPRFQKARGS